MSFFFFYKIGEQESRTGLAWGGGVGTSGRREEVGKGCRRMNMVQILCTHVCKWKMRPVETIPGMEGARGTKENGQGAEFDMIYLIYGKNFCRCHHVLPMSTTIKKRGKN
jgi:hypothetical protein